MELTYVAKEKAGPPGEEISAPKNTTVDGLVEAFFQAGPGNVVAELSEYLCEDCKRGVYYPEIHNRDGQCESCHKAGTN